MIMMLWVLGTALFSVAVGRWGADVGSTFLAAKGVTTANFRSEVIPTSFGGVMALLYLFVVLVVVGIPKFFFPLFPDALFFAVLFATGAVTFLGWLDDTLGDTHPKGFRGHIRSLIRDRRLTTGGLKALGGGVVAALCAVVFARGIGEWVMFSLYIALTTNWLNLLDLRPGRCLKFYLAAGTLLLILSLNRAETLLFVPLWGLAVALLKQDLAARVMLGDSGSNLLGIHLALWSLNILSPQVILVLLALLLVGHYYAERHSITERIERSRLLGYLDRLGRQ